MLKYYESTGFLDVIHGVYLPELGELYFTLRLIL